MRKITVLVLMLFTALSYAQVGINIATPHASSALDITSTTGGLLVPRLTETQRDDIFSTCHRFNDLSNKRYSQVFTITMVVVGLK